MTVFFIPAVQLFLAALLINYSVFYCLVVYHNYCLSITDPSARLFFLFRRVGLFLFRQYSLEDYLVGTCINLFKILIIFLSSGNVMNHPLIFLS